MILIAFLIGYAVHGILTAGERKRREIDSRKAIDIAYRAGFAEGSASSPLELIGSADPSAELARRNDISVSLYGKVSATAAGELQFIGDFSRRLPPSLRQFAAQEIYNRLLPELTDGGER